MTTYPHVRLTAAGTLGTGSNEIWSCSMKVGITTAGQSALQVPTDIDVREVASNAVTPWTTLIKFGTNDGVASALFSDKVQLVYLKAAAVMPSGKDDPTIPSVIRSAPIDAKGQGNRGATQGTAYELPYAVALCVTLTGAEIRRGSAAFGRFYLPCPNIYFSSDPATSLPLLDGQMNANVVQAFATHCAEMIRTMNQINTQLPGGHIGKVMNIGDTRDISGLRFQPVTTVSVDNRPDTIRRRQNAIGGQGRLGVAL